jgi:hypothetical protein
MVADGTESGTSHRKPIDQPALVAVPAYLDHGWPIFPILPRTKKGIWYSETERWPDTSKPKGGAYGGTTDRAKWAKFIAEPPQPSIIRQVQYGLGAHLGPLRRLVLDADSPACVAWLLKNFPNYASASRCGPAGRSSGCSSISSNRMVSN